MARMRHCSERGQRRASRTTDQSLQPETAGLTQRLSSRPAFPARRRMSCREFTEFLHEYPFGNLPAGGRAAFDKGLT